MNITPISYNCLNRQQRSYNASNDRVDSMAQNNSGIAFKKRYGLNPLHPKGQLVLGILGAAVAGLPYGYKQASKLSKKVEPPQDSPNKKAKPKMQIDPKQCAIAEAGLEDYGIKIKDVKDIDHTDKMMAEVDINGKNYKFCTEKFLYGDYRQELPKCLEHLQSSKYSCVDENYLYGQIKNAIDCQRGRFVNINGKEHFIPFVKYGIPDVNKDTLLIKYGNVQEKSGFSSDAINYSKALQAIQSKINNKISYSDLTEIEYVEKDTEYVDNLVRKRALGYHDKNTNTNYLYFEDSQYLVTNN